MKAGRVVDGEKSWRLQSDAVDAWVTETGGMVGPVAFRLGKRTVRPYSVAPWAGEAEARRLPPILRALRGDFFCMPFGANERAHRGEKHPVHGEAANRAWKFGGVSRAGDRTELRLSLATRIRKGTVAKLVRAVDGHAALYCRHVIGGMSGPMNFGHHAMLRFPAEEGSGVLSTSPFLFGQVYPGEFERPAAGGYCALKAGADFTSLAEVPRLDGGTADLTRYPARGGFEDLVMIVADPAQKVAWNAVVFPKEGYLWFSLRDPHVLRNTVLWLSNGGRHYAPWNGRHRGVMGIEDVTSYFHYGLAESAAPNPVSKGGFPTAARLSAKAPFVVNYIMGVAAAPRGFGRVESVEWDGRGIVLIPGRGRPVRAAVDTGFLWEAPGS